MSAAATSLLAHAATAPRGGVSASSFIAGRPHRHTDGTVVWFGDDTWIIAPRQSGRGQKSLTFIDLPEWLRLPAKWCLATAWLEDGLSGPWLLDAMRAFRLLARVLTHFQGPGLDQLTPDDARRVRRHLAERAERARAALERAETQAGRSLTARERRQVARRAGGLVAVSQVAHAINRLVDTAAGRGGWTPRFHVVAPRALESEPRGPGSAGSDTVLAPSMQAALLRALDHEVRRYQHARARIDAAFAVADWTRVQGKERDPTPLLERYFGLGGTPIQSQGDIAAAFGLSATSASGLGRRVRAFLQERLREDDVAEILRLRQRLVTRRGPHPSPEPDRARLLELLRKADLTWRDPNVEVLRLYFGLDGARPHSVAEIGALRGLACGRGPADRIERWTTELLGELSARRILYLRDRLPELLANAVKASAVRLQLAAARRVEALLEIAVEPAMRTYSPEGATVLEIDFRSYKGHGPDGVPDPVPCPDVYGEIAASAIATAQQLTRDLRPQAVEGDRDRLFLIPDGSFRYPTALSAKVLHAYVYSDQVGRGGGLLRRYHVAGGAGFQLHHVRQTRATHIVAGGGSVVEAARFLGHTVRDANPLAAHTFYVAGGTTEMRRRAAEAIARGAATGLQFDPVARLTIAGEAPPIEAAADVPAMQLTLAEALRRIQTGDILEPVPLSADEAVRQLRGGVVLNVTRYGGCLLPADSGPCPTAHACPVGLAPESEETRIGCGCRYQVLMPHAVDQLAADLAVMRAERAAMGGDEFAAWRAHQDVKIGIWEMQLESAQSLTRLMDGAV